MSTSVLYSEINLVCILILLLLSVKVKKSMFVQEQRRRFLYVALSNALFLLLDSAWIFVNNNALPSTVIINWILNSCYYVLSGILGYFWFIYSESIQESKWVRVKKYRMVALVPVVLLVALTIISLKTGWLFYIDSQNIYHRGPAYVFQLISSYGYVIFTAVKAFLLSLHTEDYGKRIELRTLATYVLPTLLAGGLQVLNPGLPILCIGNTIGILYIYLTLQERMISKDALTQLNNRNQLFQYLSAKLRHILEQKKLYLLMMDIDYFKSINDQYGHIEGDKALKTVAGCLRKACHKNNYFISRYGGDEFVALCEVDDKENVEEFCKTIRILLQEIDTPYTLSLSIGYAEYTADIKNQQEFIERADRELYRVKRNRCRRENERV